MVNVSTGRPWQTSRLAWAADQAQHMISEFIMLVLCILLIGPSRSYLVHRPGRSAS